MSERLVESPVTAGKTKKNHFVLSIWKKVQLLIKLKKGCMK
jgi:hypothetical protein